MFNMCASIVHLTLQNIVCANVVYFTV